MNTLGTILWLRRRMAVHELSGIAGAVNLAAGLALILVAAIGALAVAAGLGFVLHLAVASDDSAAVASAWSITLYTIAFFALVVPIIIGAGRTSFDPARLLSFPVSRSVLFRLSLISDFASKVHFAWYPTLVVATVVGVFIPGPVRLAALVGLALFAANMVVWSHTSLLVVRRVLRDRRLREIAAVLGLALILPIAFLPAAVDLSTDDADRRLDEILTIPGWIGTASSVLPPSMTTKVLVASRDASRSDAWIRILWLALWLVGGLATGVMAFDRLLRCDSSSSFGRTADGSRLSACIAAIFRPLPPTTGAVAAKEARYLLQSGVGKISLLVMPLVTAVPAIVAGRHSGMEVAGFDLQHAVFFGVMIYAVALTGYLQVNAFSWDGAGLTVAFTAPARFEDLLFGKNLGVWSFNVALALEGLVVWGLIRGFPDLSAIISGLMILASTTVLTSLVGNFTSVAFPVPRPIETVTSAASPVGALVMIGCLLVGAALAGATAVGSVALGLPSLQPIFMLAVFGLIAGTYRWSLRSAARALGDQREEVMRTLSAG